MSGRLMITRARKHTGEDDDKIKEIVSLIFGSRLVVEGTGRTFVKVPMWLAVLACVASIRLAVLTALLVVLFGMRVRVVKA